MYNNVRIPRIYDYENDYNKIIISFVFLEQMDNRISILIVSLEYTITKVSISKS